MQLKHAIGLLTLIILLTAFSARAAESQPATPVPAKAEATQPADHHPDEAVHKYLKLRSAGKRHAEALSVVTKQYGISKEELEAAANRIASNGYPEGIKQERNPGSTTSH